MAKIRIMQDAFKICERIKKIDKNYYVVFDTIKKVFEIHNSKQFCNTYCISVGKTLDMRAIKKLQSSSVSNMDKILSEIEKHNESLEKESKRKVSDMVTWRAGEIYNYAMRKGDNFDDAYTTNWV